MHVTTKTICRIQSPMKFRASNIWTRILSTLVKCVNSAGRKKTKSYLKVFWRGTLVTLEEISTKWWRQGFKKHGDDFARKSLLIAMLTYSQITTLTRFILNKSRNNHKGVRTQKKTIHQAIYNTKICRIWLNSSILTWISSFRRINMFPGHIPNRKSSEWKKVNRKKVYKKMSLTIVSLLINKVRMN